MLSGYLKTEYDFLIQLNSFVLMVRIDNYPVLNVLLLIFQGREKKLLVQ